jgi:hypothetical protein
MIEPWNLRPIQSLVASMFFEHRHVMLMLPRQEGKTELGVRLLHNLIDGKATRQAIFLTKSREAAKKMTREKFKRVFDERKFQVNTEIIFNRKNESSCIFIDSVDKRPDKLRGGTYHLVDWAEIAFSMFDLGVTIHDVYQKVVEPTLRATNGYSFLESTPDGKNGWYEMWEDYDRYSKHKRIRFPLSVLVEMGLRTKEEYEKLKKDLPELVFRQEYECDFVTFAGVAYEELLEHHIWKEMPGPDLWQQVFFAIDWGFHPSASCVLFGYELDGNLCIFDEIYVHKKLTNELADLIKEKLNYWNVRSTAGVGDHDPKAIEELNREGVNCSPADKVNVQGNRLQIKTILKQDRCFIHPRCVWLRKDLEAAQWDGENDGEINYSTCTWGHFDGEAAMRYLVRAFFGRTTQRPVEIPVVDNQSALEFANVRHSSRS